MSCTNKHFEGHVCDGPANHTHVWPEHEVTFRGRRLRWGLREQCANCNESLDKWELRVVGVDGRVRCMPEHGCS